MDLPEYPVHNVEAEEPVLLWNHRWEYDKNPGLFFETLFQLKDEGFAFKLIVTGESFSDIPPIFQKAKTILKDRLLHFGYAKSKTEYYRLLSMADVIPVTNYQDFFGGSIVEAIHFGSIPLLPGRLAYPEHIPENLHSKFIYLTDQDFKSKLKAMLANHSGLRADLASVQSHIRRYDWKELIKRYDHALAHEKLL
jgi:glycosyltransferase involved in cell wall biosynthesis